jgi:hypothetical protein
MKFLLRTLLFLLVYNLSVNAEEINDLTQGKLNIDATILDTYDHSEYSGTFQLKWQEILRDATSGGDFVISGYFYADPADVSWGSKANPEVYVKIWFSSNGILNLNFFHVGLFEVQISSLFNDKTTKEIVGGKDNDKTKISISNPAWRYLRHDYQWKVTNYAELSSNLDKPAGKFKAIYPAVDNQVYNEIQNEMRDSHAFDLITNALNETFRISENITLYFNQCNESNAFYSPDFNEVIFCYELIQEISNYTSDNDEFTGIFSFILFHELGHALVDVLDIPTTGGEEDAVDQFSTFIMISDAFEDKTYNEVIKGELNVIYAAGYFFDTSLTSLYGPMYWNEHSLNEQRFYNMLCWVYGNHPTIWESVIVDTGLLPKDRATRCTYEWDKIEKSWYKLLTPYLN